MTKETQKQARSMQLAGAIFETIWAIPIIGGLLIVSSLWAPLIIMLTFHIITLVYTVKQRASKTGPILGILASTVGIIPFVGWILHVLAAIFLYVGALKK